jgi:hypothetical protein
LSNHGLTIVEQMVTALESAEEFLKATHRMVV